MRLPDRIAEGVVAGRITLVFTRWRRARVTVGEILTTAAGRIRVDEVAPAHAIGDADARAAGFESPPELARSLRGPGGLFRLAVSPADASDEG
jgi:hypothetical protein